MREIDGEQSFELTDELVHAFGRKVEAEKLDGDELVLAGIVSSKHRAEHARANLMQNAERTERVRRRGAGSFRVQ
jgi:hypothetical protein